MLQKYFDNFDLNISTAIIRYSLACITFLDAVFFEIDSRMPLRRKIKNSFGGYSRAELLVREATSNDPTLPSQELLLQISDMTKLPSFCADTIGMIFKRLNDKCKNWRHIYKALIVIEACLQHGSLRVNFNDWLFID